MQQTLSATTHQDSLAYITANNKPTYDIGHIYDFLQVSTPQSWLEVAKDNLPLLLQDHANCEKKAAGTAMNLIFRYEFHQDLQKNLPSLYVKKCYIMSKYWHSCMSVV